MRNIPLALIAFASAGLIVLSTSPWAQADGPNAAGLTEQDHAAVEAAWISSIPSLTEPEKRAGRVCVLPAESFGGKTIAQWRAQGPDGLDELMEQLRPTIQRHQIASLTATSFGTASDLSAQDRANLLLLDQVAQQRDAHAAGLYWYTDLDAALAQAKRTNKPVLSLRMLGQLVDEYSCANSRFFRTVLYADESLGKLLREKFVLHWQSVRPVPVITIDMGDGRQIKRTITGNSAHYVLDQNGRVVECIPGLYGVDVFERLVVAASDLAHQVAPLDDEAFTQSVQQWHGDQQQGLDRVWVQLTTDSPRKAILQNLAAIQQVAQNPVQTVRPDARAASVVTRGKAVMEMPLVDAVLPNTRTPQEAVNDTELWEIVAAHYADDARLDASSQNLMRQKTIPAEQAFTRVVSKTDVENPMLRMIRNFEHAIAMDTARNEHLLHREIHAWFVQADAPLDLDALNSRVYAELFLTPEEDPWLGLVPADTYSALDAGGLSR